MAMKSWLEWIGRIVACVLIVMTALSMNMLGRDDNQQTIMAKIPKRSAKQPSASTSASSTTTTTSTSLSTSTPERDAATNAPPPSVNPKWTEAEGKAEILLQKMMPEEKTRMLHGPSMSYKWVDKCSYPNGTIINSSCTYVGNVLSIPRLSIPPLHLADGPQGFRDRDHPGTSTAWPCSLAAASSWDVELLYKWGKRMGTETREKGANVLLGPGISLIRVPLNGRNFEYLSEDPFLVYTLAQPIINGIQSENIVANAKHFVLNNQESLRDVVSSDIDERTLFEMYYPGFEGAVKANVGSVMCAYNKINEVYACENSITLGHLRNALGFRGFVVTDWYAKAKKSITSGMDILMPRKEGPSGEWERSMQKNRVSRQQINKSVKRILTSLYTCGVMDAYQKNKSIYDFSNIYNNVTSPSRRLFARKLASESAILLKNERNILPITPGKRLLVLGLATADTVVISPAIGSGALKPAFVSAPLDALREAYGKEFVEFADGTNISQSVVASSKSDVVIVFVGTHSIESKDRLSLSLDNGMKEFHTQNDLVSQLAKVHPNVVVVVSAPGAVILPWSKEVAAILFTFYPGEQAGNAMADILIGKINPSAKLPITIPNVENEINFTQNQWPGTESNKKLSRETECGMSMFSKIKKSKGGFWPCYHANYTERLLVGYRYYDFHKIGFETGFPFGHGLSYTIFKISRAEPSPSCRGVAVRVKNIGRYAGAEVVQLYLSLSSFRELNEPPQQLKGFKKLFLEVNTESVIFIPLTRRDFSVYNVQSSSWEPVQGRNITFSVGSSSRSIAFEGSFDPC